MQRSKAILIATAASLLLVFVSAVIALNAGLFSASSDNVGKLTPVAANSPAAPTSITVYVDPAAATAVTAPAPGADPPAASSGASRDGEHGEHGQHGDADDD